MLESVELGFDATCDFAVYDTRIEKYVSLKCISDYLIDCIDMAVYILDNNESFGIDRIKKLLAINDIFEKEM